MIVKTDKANEQIDDVVNKAKRADVLVQEVERTSAESFLKVLGQTQLLLNIGEDLFKAFGLSVDTQLKILISSGFSTIRVLTSLYSAIVAGDPTGIMKAQALIGLGALALSYAQIAQAQAGETQAASQTAALVSGLSGINAMIGSYL